VREDPLKNSPCTANRIFKCQQVQFLPKQLGPGNISISDYQCQMTLTLPESSCHLLRCMIIMQLFWCIPPLLPPSFF